MFVSVISLNLHPDHGCSRFLTLDFSKTFSSTVFSALLSLSEMWYWVFLWALFSSLFVHGAAGVLMFVMLQRHRQGRVISVIAISIGFLASVTGAMITSAAVAGIYRVAGKNMAPLEALVWGVGQTVLTLIISFSRILATL
ncbi:transmembrane protein 170B isoform 1-T1 [Dama dama]